jgi:hypothetical protein
MLRLLVKDEGMCFSKTLRREGKVSMSTELRLIQHLEEGQFQQKYSNIRKQDGPPPLARGAPEIFSPLPLPYTPFVTEVLLLITTACTITIFQIYSAKW